MIQILFLFIFVFIVFGQFQNQDLVKEMCETTSSTEFQRKLKEFKRTYSECDSGKAYMKDQYNWINPYSCKTCTSWHYIRESWICCDCSNGTYTNKR